MNNTQDMTYCGKTVALHSIPVGLFFGHFLVYVITFFDWVLYGFMMM